MNRRIRIARAEVEPFSMTLDREVASAAHRWQTREGALLKLYDEDGRCGIGEASPLPGVSPESTREAIDALFALAAGLRGQVLATGAAPHHPLPSVAFALETARLDLAGQLSGQSAAAILAEGRPLPASIPVCALLDRAARGPEWIASARSLAAEGFATFKVKIAGHAIAADLELLAELRAALPADHLRVDANATLSPKSAGDVLARLCAIGIELAEDPVPVAAMPALIPSPVPLAVDLAPDARAQHQALPDWIAAPAIAAVVVKPALVGGLARSIALARHATTRGVKAIVSHLMDGPVAMAAYASLALALAAMSQNSGLPACGLGPHAGLGPWKVTVPHHRGATIVPPRVPGLGLPSREALR